MAEHQHNSGSGFTSDQTRAWAMAMQIVYGLLGAGAVGFGIDLLAGTSPWFTLGLGIIGLAGGVARFIAQANAMNRASAERYTREHPRREDDGSGRPAHDGHPDLHEIDHG